MSTTIDSRVVEMQFDNKNFESNVQTSIGSIEKLNQSLNMTGASKGLEEVDTAAKKIDMSGLSNAVETVKVKFSALQVMAVTALANITNSAVNAGKRMVSALTIDPIKTGFSEYETKIGAVQTILSNTSSKGKTIEDVTKVLEELNTYADKTIYNFAEMTRNIGTFTAAGVDLEDSAMAIQGIANLAAASGSTSQQASTAMYQLSQALSSGVVKLMDWNSVTNAGMGGAKFQEALKATAREFGVNVDDMIEKSGSFRESLADGWLTADILNTTLQKFTVEGAKQYSESMMDAGTWTQEEYDALVRMAQSMQDAATKVKTFTQLWDTLKESAQSGWSQTWEIIVGDFEEAKDTLTKLSEVLGGVIEESSKARNDLLQGWKDIGGRADIVDALFNVIEAIGSVAKPIKEAFREIFPPLTVAQLKAFSEGLKNLTARMKLSDSSAEKLKQAFKGIFSILKVVIQVFGAAFKVVGAVLSSLAPLGVVVLDITASIGVWITTMTDGAKKSGIFGKAIEGIVTIFEAVLSAIRKLGGPLTGLFEGVGTAASTMGSVVSSATDTVRSSFENSPILSILQGVWKAIKAVSVGIAKAFAAIAKYAGTKISTDGIGGLLDIINSIIAGGIGVYFMNFIKSLKNVTDGFGDIVENAGEAMGNFAGVLEGYQNKLKADALMKIAGAIAILVAAIVILSFVDNEKLYDSIIAISFLFGSLMTSLSILGKSSGQLTGVTKASTIMIAMSTAVLILASALKKVSDIDQGALASSLLGIGTMMAMMIATVKILGAGKGKTALKGATQMILFAAAIKVLASACRDLSNLNWSELARGLTGVGVLLAEVALFMRTAKFSGKSITTATGIVILASAIKILASACKDFANMDWEEIAKGLSAVGVLLAEVAVFTKLTSNAKHVIYTGIALIAIAAAMKIFASVCSDFAQMSWEEIAKGLVSMAGALLTTAVALKLMPKNALLLGVSLIAISSALVIMANALRMMGDMSWESIAKGLLTLGGSMVILAVGMNAMRGTAGASASLLIAITALALFAPVLKELGSMSWGSIAKGLIFLASAFTIVGLAGLLLKPIIAPILSVAGAIALVGVGVLALGAGLMAAGAGLTSLAVGFTALIGALAVSVSSIVSIVSALVAGVIKGIGEGIIAFCEVIAAGAPAIGEALKALIITACDILVECVPVLVDTVLVLVAAVLEGLVAQTPRIVDAIFKFLIGLLEGIARNMPGLIQAVVDVFMSFFDGVLSAIGNIDLDTLIKGIGGIGLMTVVMAALAGVAALAPAAMAGVIAMGTVVAELAIVLGAIGALAQITGLDWLIGEGGKLLQSIGTAIGNFVGGIVGGVAEGISSSFPQIGSNLSQFMINVQPFIDGAKQIDASVLSGVATIVGVLAALTGANILSSISSWITGGSSLADFGTELAEFGPSIKRYADSIKGIDSSAITASASAAKALAEMCSHIPNSGGVASWFAGENSISQFGGELVSLGEGLKGFADAVSGVSPETIVAAANAAKALAEMCSHIPNSGGVASWFAGENSIALFAGELVDLGKGLKGFSDAVEGVSPEAIRAAADAAKSLVELASNIPNSGGVVSWIIGDNSISKFGADLVLLGLGLKGFADAVAGVNVEAMTASVSAARELAEMSTIIPNSGGLVSWFTGDNSIAMFAGELVDLGKGLKGFADAVTGVDTVAMANAAESAKTLAELSGYIPNSGGITSWFTGESSIAKFGGELVDLGKGLKGFADAVTGINVEAMTSAAGAAKSLAEMASIIPNSGGVVTWFTGDNSIAKFGVELIDLGKGLKGFSKSVTGMDAAAMTAATDAAKNLAEMANTVPNSGGVVTWFTGDNSIAKFGGELTELGKGLKGFSSSVGGISPENVIAAANAAKALAEMANTIPDSGGVVSWFAGDNSIAKFGDELPTLGRALKGFSDSVVGIAPANVTAAADAAKNLADMSATAPENTDKIVGFGNNLKLFGSSLAGYFKSVSTVNADSVKSSSAMVESVNAVSNIDVKGIGAATTALDKLSTEVLSLSSISGDTTKGFVKALNALSKISLDSLITAFKNGESDIAKSGKEIIKAFIKGAKEAGEKLEDTARVIINQFNKGVTKQKDTAIEACDTIINACSKAFSDGSDKFAAAGKNVVKGFASGITENTYLAEAKAKAMAKAAAKAAKEALDINSPSRVFREIGKSVPEGFAMGIDKLSSVVADSSTGMANGAVDGVRASISRIADVINSDIDAQPTIRPVLDLSDVRSGAGMIGSMLDVGSSVGVMSSVGSISTMMSRRIQNGSNSDVVSAIDKLRKDLGSVGNTTYNIDGITYDDGSNLAGAIETIIRAAKIERRV